MQGGEGATVRWCVIGAAIGATVRSVRRSVRRWDRYDGVARLIYFRFYFLLEQREREIEQKTAGVAGGASGWLGVARDGRKQRAGSREQRVRREIAK